MSEPWAEAGDPKGHPWRWDALWCKRIGQGFTDEEVFEYLPHARDWPSGERRLALVRIAALRRELDVRPAVTEAGGDGLTREQILTARRAWQNDGPPADYKRALTSRATWYRKRQEYGLTPWPAEYKDRI